jgi:hypothetical protein
MSLAIHGVWDVWLEGSSPQDEYTRIGQRSCCNIAISPTYAVLQVSWTNPKKRVYAGRCNETFSRALHLWLGGDWFRYLCLGVA